MGRLSPEQQQFARALLSIKGSEAQRALHRDMLELLLPRLKDSEVFEAGCGGGSFTRKMLSGGPRHVVAADLNVVSLEALHERALPHLSLLQLDLQAPLAFGDDSFDVLVCSSVLMHLPPEASARAIAEFARVLRPQGFFILAVLHEAYAAQEYPPAPEFGREAREIAREGATGKIIEFYPEVSHYRDALHHSQLRFVERDVCHEDGTTRWWRLFISA